MIFKFSNLVKHFQGNFKIISTFSSSENMAGSGNAYKNTILCENKQIKIKIALTYLLQPNIDWINIKYQLNKLTKKINAEVQVILVDGLLFKFSGWTYQ